jgi:opacity protein-like surface antigen
VNIAAFTANALFEVPSGGFTPYVIGGGGLYRLDDSIGGDAQNEFGFNIGGGISMPLSGFKVFVEARYHRVNTEGGSTAFVPIVFGAIF